MVANMGDKCQERWEDKGRKVKYTPEKEEKKAQNRGALAVRGVTSGMNWEVAVAHPINNVFRVKCCAEFWEVLPCSLNICQY